MTTSFLQILHQHAARYPLMTPTDYGKLAYQSEFGPGHMISDKQAALSRLLEEWQVIAAAPGSAGTGLCPERRQIAGGDAPSHAAAPTAEPIGDGLCRFHLNGDYNPAQAAPLLTELFSRTALEHTGTKEGLAGKLSLLGGLSVPGMAQWLNTRERAVRPCITAPYFGRPIIPITVCSTATMRIFSRRCCPSGS